MHSQLHTAQNPSHVDNKHPSKLKDVYCLVLGGCSSFPSNLIVSLLASDLCQFQHSSRVLVSHLPGSAKLNRLQPQLFLSVHPSSQTERKEGRKKNLVQTRSWSVRAFTDSLINTFYYLLWEPRRVMNTQRACWIWRCHTGDVFRLVLNEKIDPCHTARQECFHNINVDVRMQLWWPQTADYHLLGNHYMDEHSDKTELWWAI